MKLDEALLFTLAREAIAEGFGQTPPRRPLPPWAHEKRAVFVTLKKHGELRGCVGQLAPRYELHEAVRQAARAAAFDDNRFPPLAEAELREVELEVSVLAPMEDVDVDTEEELLAALRPGVDGLVLANGPYRAVFIPEVWKELPEPRDFVAHLKRKAGMPPRWMPGTHVQRFTAACFHEGR